MTANRYATMALPHDVRARIAGIIDRVARRGVGCVHLEREPVGVLCLMHPATVRCVACMATHIGTHSYREEMGCDGCDGTLDDAEFLALAQPFEVDTTVSIGRGRRAAVGVICVIGYGLCDACWPKAVTP